MEPAASGYSPRPPHFQRPFYVYSNTAMHATLPLLQVTGFPAIHRARLTTLQVNLGYRCNQSCVHCHVNAGPNRTEMMDEANLALRGYDPVAYFSAGKPSMGDARFSTKFNGATYHFASAESLRTFKASPASYAPQYGGFCAMGVALEKKLDGDPTAWKIVGDKLYLNLNKDVQKKWNEDVPGNLVKAASAWPLIKAKAPKDL